MKLTVFLVLVVIFLTKLTEQGTESGTGAKNIRRPAKMNQIEWITLDLAEEEADSVAFPLDSLSEVKYEIQKPIINAHFIP